MKPLPESALLDAALASAARRAGLQGAVAVEPEHLLLGLLSYRDCVACRLLAHVGVSIESLEKTLGWENPRADTPLPRASATLVRAGMLVPADPAAVEVCLSPGAVELLRSARNLAAELGNSFVGTDHLLLALAQSDGTVGTLLRAQGAPSERVLAWLSSVRSGRDTTGFFASWERLDPLVVRAAMGILIVHALCFCVPTTPFNSVPTRAVADAGPVLGTALQLVRIGLPVCLAIFAVDRTFRPGQDIWATLQGWLTARAALSIAGLLYLLPMLLAERGLFGYLAVLYGAVYTTPMCLLAWKFFATHPWFGVEERQVWRTLRRRGAWVMLLTLALELLPTLLAAWTSAFQSRT